VIVDPDSPPPDLPLRDAVVRLRSAYPASVLAGACFGIPIAIVAALLPDLLSWLGYGAALAFDSAAVLAASWAGGGDGRPVAVATRRGIVETVGRAWSLTAAYAAGTALALPLVGAVAFLTGLLGLGLFAVFLTVLWAILVVSRGSLLIPAVVLRDLGPTDAFDLATSVVDGFVIETAGLLFVGLVVAVGPPFALAVAGLLLGWPVVLTALAASLVLALTVPPTAIGLGTWLDTLETYRRRVDAEWGRP
jgi:hypothetical protein